MPVDVVINFEALPGRAIEVRALLSQGRDISRAADGCKSFELYQRDDDEHRFMFLERWTSIEAHHVNMATNIVASGHLARIIPLIVGPPDNGVSTGRLIARQSRGDGSHGVTRRTSGCSVRLREGPLVPGQLRTVRGSHLEEPDRLPPQARLRLFVAPRPVPDAPRR